MGLEEERFKIEHRLLIMVKEGILKPTTINSNFVEASFAERWDNVEFYVDGVRHRPGWLAKNITNMETVRTVWSKMRDYKAKEIEELYKKVFGKDADEHGS